MWAVLAAVHFLLSVTFTIYVLMSRLLPHKYAVLLILAVAAVTALISLLFLTRGRTWKKLTASVMMLLSLVVYVVGAYVLHDVNRLIAKVSSSLEENDYSVIVMNGSSYEDAQEVGRENVALVNEHFQAVLAELLPNNKDYDLRIYATYPDLVDALYGGREELILIDEAFRDIIRLVHANFNVDTRVLASTNPDVLAGLTFSTDVDFVEQLRNADDEAAEDASAQNDRIERGPWLEPLRGDYREFESRDMAGAEPFTMIISGMDTYGAIDTKSRSDVNIVLAINPRKNELFMVPVPRDAYVTIAETGYKDKLTHAGVLGVETTKKSVANAMSMPIDYYVKINFSTLEQLVDLLGGITVDNPYEFTSRHGKNHFPVGKLRLDGKLALYYSRERYALPGGDFERGMNQTRVIRGLINEAIKPHNLTKFSTLLEQLSDSFVTDLPDLVIRAIIQEQISNGGSWTVDATSIKAYGEMGLPSYMMPGWNLYFAVLDEDSVAEAREKLLSVLESD